MLSTHKNNTKELNTPLTVTEFSDIVSLKYGEEELQICVNDLKEVIEILQRAQTDIETYPESFEIFNQ